MRVAISSEPRLLGVLRGVVRFRAEQVGFPPGDAECLAVAVTEAAANVIQHAYGNRPDGRLALEIETFPDRVELVLEDTAPKVRPELIRPRSLEDVRPGGLGTHFIKCFVDICSYDEDFAEGNRLRLVKYLPGKVCARGEGRSQAGG